MQYIRNEPPFKILDFGCGPGRDLKTFAELPERSIVYHVDQGDVVKAHQVLGNKFCISGGIPNVMLSFGKPEEVRAFCRRVIEEVAGNGGYIMDAGAIMQDDTSIENLRVMTETARDYGAYSAGSYKEPSAEPPGETQASRAARKKMKGMTGQPTPRVRPGGCFPWEERVKDLPEITGSPELIRKIWEDIDAFGNMYIWQLLLSF